MIEKARRSIQPLFEFPVFTCWVEMGNEGKVADHVLFLRKDVLKKFGVDLLGIGFKLAYCYKKVADMVHDSGVNEGFIHFENFALKAWYGDDWEAVVKFFEVVLEHVELHSLDKWLKLAVENTDIVLPIFEGLRRHVGIDVPLLIALEWPSIGEG